jgi:hypothetical protein
MRFASSDDMYVVLIIVGDGRIRKTSMSPTFLGSRSSSFVR